MSLDPRIDDKYVKTNGYRVRYIEKGEGQPLLMFHGLGAALSADQWLVIIDSLSTVSHVYALDMPGWGLSDLPAIGYSFDMFTETIHGFVEALGLQSVDVFGQSMGGWWAGLYAYYHPERVRRAILVGAAGLNPVSGGMLAPFELMNREQIRNSMLREWGGFLRVEEDHLDELERRMNLPGRREAYEGARATIFNPEERQKYSLRDKLPKMEMPILMAWGDNGGGVVTLQHGLEAFQLAPNARLVITYGGDHNAAGFTKPAFQPQAIQFLTDPEVKPVTK
jgi:pimeloyl-ACP methyl ester carboxylesterase